MSSPDTDKVFSGSIAKLYEPYLVPLIFEPYASDLVNRLAAEASGNGSGEGQASHASPAKRFFLMMA